MPTLDPHAFLPLSVAQVRLLLQAVLPQPVLDLPAVLELIAYQQRRKRAAYSRIANGSWRAWKGSAGKVSL